MTTPEVAADSNAVMPPARGSCIELVFRRWPSTHVSENQVFSNQIPADSIQSLEVFQASAGGIWRTRRAWSQGGPRAPDWVLNKPVGAWLSYGVSANLETFPLTWTKAAKVGQRHCVPAASIGTLSRSSRKSHLNDKGKFRRTFAMS